MKQFGTIWKFEMKSFLKNKVFIGTTIFLVALIAVVMFFPRIKALFAAGASDDAAGVDPSDRPVMLLKAEDEMQREGLREAFAGAFPDYEVESSQEELSRIKDQITSGQAECAFVLSGPAAFTYYVDNLSMYDANTEIASDVLKQFVQMTAMRDSGMSAEEIAAVMNLPIQGQTESLGKDQMQNFFYTYIMIFALYMVILLYGQMIATNVATEKSSRAMELLITSAKPTSMMFGKVLASCLAGFVQILAVFGSALVFYNLNEAQWEGNQIVKSIFNIPPVLLGYMLVFFVLGFLIYAFMYGAVGSTASKVEDINTSSLPITLLFVIAFLVVVSSMSSGYVDNTAMLVCSYLPFTSPMAMFTRIAMSTVAWYEIALSIGILIASTIGIGLLSAKIYRVGVLLYGTPPKITNIIKAVWKA